MGIGADPVGARASGPPQIFGCGGLIRVGPHENFTEIMYTISKIDTRSGFVSQQNVLSREAAGETQLGSL